MHLIKIFNYCILHTYKTQKEGVRANSLLLDPITLQLRQISTQKSRLSLVDWGSLWYENRAKPSSSDCCYVFILPTRCPLINLWLILALCLKRLVLDWLILDCCCCRSEKTSSVSHKSFKVLNNTRAKLSNPQFPVGPGCSQLQLI